MIGVFDCCRADFTPPHRGGISNQPVDDFDEDEEDADRNCVLTFGCGPNSTVAAVSTIAQEYLERFSQEMDDSGTITFPSMSFL